MASNVTVKVDGLRQLGNAIQRMNKKVATKVIRSAVVAGSKIIVAAAKANAPIDTGALKKSIKSLRDKQNSRVGFEIRAVSVFKVTGIYADTQNNVRKGRVGKKYLKDPPTFYWKFNELGTVRQKAIPFIEPALANNIQKVTDAMKAKLIEGILKEKI